MIHPSARGRWLAVLVLIGVLLLEWGGWLAYRQAEQRKAQGEFERVAAQSMLSIQQQTALYRNALLGLQALYVASEGIEPNEFREYVEALGIDRNLRGIRAFAFNREVRGNQLDRYVSRVQHEMRSRSPVYEEFHIQPPGTRARYHVVEMIEPFEENQGALGYDLLTSTERRQAIDYAVIHGFSASAPVRLKQDPTRLSVLILAPVHHSLRQGRSGLMGTVAASFQADDMVAAAASPGLHERYYLRWLDLGPSDVATDTLTPLYADITSPHDRQLFDRLGVVRAEYVFGGRRWRFEFTQRAAPSQETWVVPLLLASMAVLVSALVNLGWQRRRRAAMNSALADLGTDCVFVLDTHGVVIETDRAVGRITGRPAAHWLFAPFWNGLAEEDRDKVEMAFNRARQGRENAAVEFRVQGEDGQVRWFSARIGDYRTHHMIGQVLVQTADISARKTAEAAVARLAFFDALTGLPNRRLLEERALLTLASAERRGSEAAVLMLDLDGFKQINDTAGHAVGDAVLQEVALRLTQVMRDTDTVARMGGDEFVLLLAEPAGLAEARRAARRVIAQLRDPIVLDQGDYRVTTSVGIAIYPHCGHDLQTLLRAADEAMYRAKTGGRDRAELAGGIDAVGMGDAGEDEEAGV